MKKKIIYTDEPLGDIQVVEDFLPSPEQFIFKGDEAKVADDAGTERRIVGTKDQEDKTLGVLAKSNQTSKRFVKSSAVLKATLGRYSSSFRRVRKKDFSQTRRLFGRSCA